MSRERSFVAQLDTISAQRLILRCHVAISWSTMPASVGLRKFEGTVR
jgi:hypothetical protein